MNKHPGSYPEHLYDPLRRKIAVRYIQHELKKLFPSLTEAKTWRLINKDVENWFSKNILLTPVRVFWNGFHGIARGFRFKNLLPRLTSKNIQWQEKKVKLAELQFGSIFEGLGQYLLVPEAKAKLDLPENLHIKKELLSKLKQKGGYGAPRNTDPVIAVTVDGNLRVIDGNRRLFEAMCSNADSITAFVGEPVSQPEIFEDWVPASFLQDLLSLHSRNPAPTADFTLNIAKVISESLKYSTSGRMEWRVICLKSTNPLDMEVYNKVAKILNT